MAIFTGLSKQLGGTEKETPKDQFFYGLVQKEVLVTGSGGQLGSELKVLTERMNVPFRFHFTDADSLDVTNRGQIDDYVKIHQIQYIINCAAYTAVDKAETDSDKAFAVNAGAVENIAAVAKQHGTRVIHISTDYVFDGSSTIPYTEDREVNPLSVYGASKRRGEEVLQLMETDWMIIRTCWMYSEFGSNFVKTMIRLMNEREKLTVVEDEKGTPTYAADLAEMIVHILRFSEENEWKSGIYHFSNRGEVSRFEFAGEIKKRIGNESCELVPITADEFGSPAKRPGYSVLDTSKISYTFHVEIPAWKEALERCVQKLRMQNYH